MREHPLRRRYGLELGLGLALAGAAAWLVLGGGLESPTPAASRPVAEPASVEPPPAPPSSAASAAQAGQGAEDAR